MVGPCSSQHVAEREVLIKVSIVPSLSGIFEFLLISTSRALSLPVVSLSSPQIWYPLSFSIHPFTFYNTQLFPTQVTVEQYRSEAVVDLRILRASLPFLFQDTQSIS